MQLASTRGLWFFTCFFLAVISPGIVACDEMEWVQVSGNGEGFTLEPSGAVFHPWGFNYDQDGQGNLLEDYWETDWAKVEKAFREMKQVEANVVRIHLQFGKFMKTADEPITSALDRLDRLVRLAERERLYLDLTGLGCYRKQDVPKWYDDLGEQGRWAAQARFWEAVAERCARSPAIFCYDLMNEPLVPGSDCKPGDWLPGSPYGGMHYVQHITLHRGARPRPAIARQWVHTLVVAIRKHDQKHLVTVGLVDWSLDRPGLTSGFVPKEIAGELDFLSVHLYPVKSKLTEDLDTLRGFAVGKPVVIEETGPLNCSVSEWEEFLDRSKGLASGWIGFYWSKMPEEYRKSKDPVDAIKRQWLELFQERAREFNEPALLNPQ
jgi:hypothetical protein